MNSVLLMFGESCSHLDHATVQVDAYSVDDGSKRRRGIRLGWRRLEPLHLALGFGITLRGLFGGGNAAIQCSGRTEARTCARNGAGS